MHTRAEAFTPLDLSIDLGIGERTLANWRSAGKGPRFMRYGNRIRYLKEDVEAWRAAQRHESTREYAGAAGMSDAREPAKPAKRDDLIAQLVDIVRQIDELDRGAGGHCGAGAAKARASRRSQRHR